ncbi:hypothetical protein U9M48_020908 [Paspalum notatum var. saurae]|uniref:Cathepsin propeptide inhibitor domain-containing protein n=1 Tax=Paspalum notatum var. saurae TaxID=547442 RepID=A0AAQ3WSH1_PASNO
MALRALGSLLAPRLWPRRIRRAQTQAESWLGIFAQAPPGSVAERPARSFHTMRDLAVGDGVYGAAATAGFAGLLAILYFTKDTEKSDVAGQLTDEEEGRKEVPNREALKERHGYLSQEAAIEDVDEAAMKSRFHDWMKKYGRSYKTEEEKARRFEIFKESVMWADKMNASTQTGARFAPNGFADWTDEECETMDLDLDWEKYNDLNNLMAAKGYLIDDQDQVVGTNLPSGGVQHSHGRLDEDEDDLVVEKM